MSAQRNYTKAEDTAGMTGRELLAFLDAHIASENGYDLPVRFAVAPDDPPLVAVSVYRDEDAPATLWIDLEPLDEEERPRVSVGGTYYAQDYRHSVTVEAIERRDGEWDRLRIRRPNGDIVTNYPSYLLTERQSQPDDTEPGPTLTPMMADRAESTPHGLTYVQSPLERIATALERQVAQHDEAVIRTQATEDAARTRFEERRAADIARVEQQNAAVNAINDGLLRTMDEALTRIDQSRTALSAVTEMLAARVAALEQRLG